MNIRDASERSGVTAKTIRYYEQIGLTPKPERQANGYRSYADRDVETLRFVNRARKLGFSLRDISDLLALWQDTERSSAEVKALVGQHIDDLDQRIADMKAVRRVLHSLSQQCNGDNRPDCPILDDLAAGPMSHDRS